MAKLSLIEDMDHSVQRMLKLIEEDADTFAKKAEMYYEKRPELITLVEDFHRMYRSLAERYDHVTLELKRSIQSDVQSQCSDVLCELTPKTCHSPALSLGHRKSGHRAPGFDFFLGSGGSCSDLRQKELDESSTLTDSEAESDDYSSVNNYAGMMGNTTDQGLSKKVMELEIELRATKEKLRMQNDENGYGSLDLAVANERMPRLEEEVDRLSTELQKYKATGQPEGNLQTGEQPESEEAGTRNLQRELSMAYKDTNAWKTKFSAKKREVFKLQERLARMKDSLSDRDHEVRELKVAVFERDEVIKNMEKSIDDLKEDVGSRDKQLHELISERDELRSKAKDLEDEVEKQRTSILEGEEEKREAIRQLCFSLEHYRNRGQGL